MTAFSYRMGAGSPGEVTRIHPSSIRAFNNDASTHAPLTYTGQAALYDGTYNTVRAVNNSADSSKGAKTVAIAGIVVRPYPTQDSGSGETFGAAAYGAISYPAAGGILDLLTQGSILVTQNQPQGTYAAASQLGGTVYVRVITGTTGGFSSGGTYGLPVGGFETVQDTNTLTQFAVANAVWNGPADQFGVAEITLID